MDYPGIDCLNPSYDKAFLIHVTPAIVKDGKIPPISLELINGTSTVLGTIVVTHDDIASASNHTLSETRSIGKKGAKVQFQICLQGVQTSPETTSLLNGTATPPAVSNEAKGELRGTQPSALLAVVNSPPGKANGGTVSSPMPVEDLSERLLDESDPTFAEQSRVRVTAMGGRGFQVRKTAFFLADDVPDTYLNISFGSHPQVWRTTTSRNTLTPEWNEYRDYVLHSHGQIISVDVFDEAEGEKRDRTQDILFGSVRVTVGKVLFAGGVVEKEILTEGKGTGAFISIRCELLNE